MDDIRTNGNILEDSLEHISPEAVKGGKLFPAGTVIVATSATIGEHALLKVPALSNQRFTALITKSEFSELLIPEFVHYYCFVLDDWCMRNTTQSSFASVDMHRFRKFKFPVPPLEVQQEIVRVLDAFTGLEQSLVAELELRKKQYEFYRDELLTFAPKEA
jgi:type I restriction enzyme S subunit